MTSVLQPLASLPAVEPAATGARGVGAGADSAVALAGPVGTQPPTLNPALCIDAALGVVVMQFYDDRGDVTASIPTARQLQAYRVAGGHAGVKAAGSEQPAADPSSAPAKSPSAALIA
jgi:hypothetical protein